MVAAREKRRTYVNMVHVHYAAREKNVVEEIRDKLRGLVERNLQPQKISMAPDVERDVLRECDPLTYCSPPSSKRMTRLLGIPVVIDEARAPRGVLIE